VNFQELKPMILQEILKKRGKIEKKELRELLRSQCNQVLAFGKKFYWALEDLKNSNEVKQDGDLIALKTHKKIKKFSMGAANNFFGRRFETECKRILEHLGFNNIKLTGKKGDKGLDGRAEFPIYNHLRIKVLFQCKSSSKKVGSPTVREFRGSILGKGTAGILFASQGFSNDAKKEALKLNTPQIFLFDKNNINSYYKEKISSFTHES